MTIGARRSLPAALTGCLGLLVVAVAACLWPQTWHPQDGGTAGGSAVRPGLVPGLVWSVAGWSAAGDPTGPAPALVPHRAQELIAAILTHGGAADGPPGWWGAACLLLLCMTVASGPRGVRPRAVVHRHGTRAPPLRS